MRKRIITYNQVIGFHFYPDAPVFCSYLSQRHRHVFAIRCDFRVIHNEREIEFNQQQEDISKFLSSKFGSPCEFNGMSCESIAEMLLNSFPAMEKAEVLEDGFGGAIIQR